MNSQVLNLPVRLVFAMILAVMVLPVSGAALPGCPTSCGNLAIPFPFGIGSNCSLDDKFFIICNNTFNPPKPFLRGPIEVFDISLDGHLKVPSYMAHSCYEASGRISSYYVSLRTGAFFISASRNKFTAVGCDTYAFAHGFLISNYTIGCTAMCDGLEDVKNGSCNGIGCCDMSIPVGVRDFKVNVSSYKNHAGVKKFNPCGYAFVAEEGYYNFSSADLWGLRYKTNASFPVVLEWSVGKLTCQEAQKNKAAYYCQSVYSECIDSLTGEGHLCACQHGFQGNPYIKDGCQDINECEISSPCDGICINRPGSFECSCPDGYEGDGRREGIGCGRKRKGAALYVTIGVTTSVGVLFLVAASFVSYKLFKRRRDKKIKEKIFKRNEGLLLQNQLSNDENVIEKITIFTATELEKATENFNENRILGRGGQGTVYKGMLTDGRIVAIKKSKLVDESQLQQFINEVVVLSKVVHKNVVRLLGCCMETEVPLLVYEFIVNGNLYKLIHNDSDEFLTWNIRLRIATEIAGALAYLHSAISIPIYHRDIKSSNILLDEKYTAKVSDFGTSRSIGDDKTHVTTLVKGTFGYLDPEYFQSSHFTEKSDVYSFGVVLVELLTRQKAISLGSSEEGSSLATRFLASMEQNCLSTILDAQIRDDGNRGEIMIVAKLAEKCLNLNGKKRPTMKEVAMELERIRPKTDRTSQANFLSLGRIEEGPESDTSFIWTTTSSSVGSVSDDHPLLFSTI